jgi:hypothetical protein
MNAIITWANDDNKTFLSEFIVSLRTLGKYTDKVIVIDYGLPDWFKNIFSGDIEFVPCENEDINIETHKFLSILPLISNYDKLVLLDADMWFQENINYLFEYIPENGTLCATEQNNFFFKFQEGFVDLLAREEDIKKVYKIKELFGVQINAGFVAGSSKTLFNKFSLYSNMLDEGLIKKKYGADQLFLNIDFNTTKDDASYSEYNTIVTNAINLGKDLGVHKKEKDVVAKILHVACSMFMIPIDVREVLFRFRHTHLYVWYLQQLGVNLDDVSSNVFQDLSLKEEFIFKRSGRLFL